MAESDRLLWMILGLPLLDRNARLVEGFQAQSTDSEHVFIDVVFRHFAVVMMG